MGKIKDRLLSWYRRFRQWQVTPAEVPPLDRQQVVCLNCGESYEGAFCPRCGQPAKTARFNIKTITRNALDVWGMGSRSMPRALIHLTLRPGYMIADYLRGHRQPYFPPFKMLFILTATALLIANALPGEKPKEDTAEQPMQEKSIEKPERDKVLTDMAESVIKFSDFIERISKTEKPIYLLLSQALFTIGMFLLFSNSPAMGRMTITEQFYVQVLMACQLQFFSIIYMLLSFEVSFDDFALPMKAIALVAYVDFYQLYGFGWWRTLLKLTAAILLIFLFMFVGYSIGSLAFYGLNYFHLIA